MQKPNLWKNSGHGMNHILICPKCEYQTKLNEEIHLTKLNTYQNLIWYSFFSILYDNQFFFGKVAFIHLSSYIANIFTTYSLYYSNNSIKQAVVFCSNWVNDTQKWIVTIDTFARRTNLGRTPKKKCRAYRTKQMTWTNFTL